MDVAIPSTILPYRITVAFCAQAIKSHPRNRQRFPAMANFFRPQMSIKIPLRIPPTGAIIEYTLAAKFFNISICRVKGTSDHYYYYYY